MPADFVWEQRWHPFREEWVLFTSHRAGRPWIGETKPPQSATSPSYDPSCYLCPGPEIGGGSMTNESNPDLKAAELRAVSTRLYREDE